MALAQRKNILPIKFFKSYKNDLKTFKVIGYLIFFKKKKTFQENSLNHTGKVFSNKNKNLAQAHDKFVPVQTFEFAVLF